MLELIFASFREQGWVLGNPLSVGTRFKDKDIVSFCLQQLDLKHIHCLQHLIFIT